MLISIRNHQFTLQAPYAEGHQLTAAEAHALNGLRGENIRDAAAKKFGQRALDAQGLQRLHSLVQQYDREYHFKEPTRGPGSPAGAQWSLEAVARGIAEAKVRAVWSLETESESFERTVLEMAKEPEVLQEAAEKIEAEKRVAAQALEELLGP